MTNTFVQELEELIKKHSTEVEDTFSNGLFGGYLVKLKSGETVQIDLKIQEAQEVK